MIVIFFLLLFNLFMMGIMDPWNEAERTFSVLARAVELCCDGKVVY